MKRILTLLGFGLGLATAAHAQSPHIGVVGMADSCGFGTTGSLVMSYATMSGGTPATCVMEINYGDGSKMDTLSFSGTGPSYVVSSSHSYSVSGTYSMKHVLICSGSRMDSVTKSVQIGCTYIYGYLYQDANSNCIHNSAEHLVYSNADIRVDSAGIAVDTLHTTAYWHYPMHGPTGTVWTFTVLGNPAGFVASCSTSISYTYMGIGPAVQRDFGFNCSATAVYDYQLHFSRALRGASSPGASYIYLYASQTTCHSGTGTVTLNVSPKFSINSSGISPTPSSVSGNTVTWTLSGLSNGAWHYLYVPLTPLSTTANGDTACNYAIITPAVDANPANNIISQCDSVKASWDPNEKSVRPLETLASGSLLQYTIDFENLGNDTAFNIHIQDTLSADLDANSFMLTDASHPVSPSIYQAGGKNILKFDFAGINLEDRSVPTRNKGQVRFTMRLRNGLADGTTVANRAGIYFDGNPVVMTNDASVTLPVPQGVGTAPLANPVQVFPNPAGGHINIVLSQLGWEQASLSNAVGQVVLRQSLTQGRNSLDVASLPAGIYYLQVQGAAGSQTTKIQKQ
jgi:uncharacterized repeat protein (TIGR01451 family)